MLSGRNKLTPTPRPPCPRADLAARMCALCGRASSGRLGAAGGSMFRPSSSWIPKPVRRCAVGAIFQVAGGCWWAPPWLTQVCEADFCLFSESECTAPSSPVMIPLFVPLPPKKRKERKKARVPGAVRNVTLSLYLHCSFLFNRRQPITREERLHTKFVVAPELYYRTYGIYFHGFSVKQLLAW